MNRNTILHKIPLLLAVLALTAIFSLSLTTPVLADGIIVPEPPVCIGCGPLPLTGALNIRNHHVTVTIEDQIAITQVDQVFHNPNEFTIEGTYIFPLPKDATVTEFKLWIDGQAVEGRVLSAEEARATYEEIVRQMIDPALLEYVDRGAVQASIFPIEPNDTRRIQLEYSQVLAAENGLVRYAYPLNTEKFSAKPLEQVTISVDVQSSTPIRAAYSPSHEVAVSREGEHHVRVGFEAADVRPDSDFVLYYSLGETEAMHLLSYRNPADPADPNGYYLMLLAPSPDAHLQVLPKDVMLVIDRSGSMDGEKYRQAQDALAFILENLNPEDRFNVIAFSTGLETFSRGLVSAAEAPAAVEWVNSSRPIGSTDINRALLEAVQMVQTNSQGPAGRPAYVIFLTDGLPTEGEVESAKILDNLRATAPDHIRLFTFGVGYDVDTFLLDLLAEEHHGSSTYVNEGERIDEIVGAFYQKISTPVMTDLVLEVDGITVLDDYPSPLPDLFVGSQVVVVGRYRDGGLADVILRGNINGQTHTFTFPEQIFESQSDLTGQESAIPRLWATRKIGHLLRDIRLHGPNQETIEQIVSLSIRFGIVTPYTSYLVTEPTALGAEEQNRISEDAFAEAEAADDAVSGEGAVERASDEGALESADSVAAPSLEDQERVRVVGARTFLNVDGIWIDTAFDPDAMQTVEVAFLSDDYFALAAAFPELGAAFALGERVIAFADGTAYEVVAADSSVDPVDIQPTIAASTQIDPDVDGPGEQIPAEPDTPDAEAVGLACLGSILSLLLIPAFIYLRYLRE
jgi:Ca-activated chloride channel family protein